MAVYRTDTPGSWTSVQGSWMADGLRDRLKGMLDALDRYTDGKYRREIALRKRLFDSNGLLAQHRYAALFAPGEIGVTLRRVWRDTVRNYRNLCLSLRKG